MIEFPKEFEKPGHRPAVDPITGEVGLAETLRASKWTMQTEDGGTTVISTIAIRTRDHMYYKMFRNLTKKQDGVNGRIETNWYRYQSLAMAQIRRLYAKRQELGPEEEQLSLFEEND